jgi:hypothetical protein
VLVGFADALAAPEAAASLLGAGYRVVSFSRRGRAVPLRRLRGVEIVEVTAPEDDFHACVEEVGAIAAAHDVTMPLDDQAMLVCDRALPVDALVAGPRGAQAELALDKRLQLRGAGEAGLRVPDWSELDPQGGLPAGWKLPVMLKPALAAEVVDGRLRRFAPRLVASIDEFEGLRRSWGPSTPAIVQQWVQGDGCGVFGLADDGATHHLSAHRRVRMMNPAGSGSSACASEPLPEPVTGPIERMLAVAQWRGMFMIELLRAGDTWWFMELNGRPWGSLALARRLGFEYPAWAVAGVLDERAAIPQPPPFQELLCRHLGREIVHLLFVLRGPGSHVGAWPGRRETLRSLLGGERRRGRRGRTARTAWYNLTPDMRRVFVEDTWRTVSDQTFRKLRS